MGLGFREVATDVFSVWRIQMIRTKLSVLDRIVNARVFFQKSGSLHTKRNLVMGYNTHGFDTSYVFTRLQRCFSQEKILMFWKDTELPRKEQRFQRNHTTAGIVGNSPTAIDSGRVKK